MGQQQQLILGGITMVCGLLAWLPSLPAVAQTQGDSTPCSAQVSAQLAALSLTANDIEKTTFGYDWSVGRGGGSISGVQVWHTLKGQPGSLVMVFGRGCGLRQLYTRDGLDVPGVDC